MKSVLGRRGEQIKVPVLTETMSEASVWIPPAAPAMVAWDSSDANVRWAVEIQRW